LNILNITQEQLTSIDGIGEQMALSFIEFIRVNKELVEKLFDIIKPTITKKQIVSDNPFKNKTVVITGTLSKSRGEFKKLLESLGAKVSSSVSKKTDYLLYGEDAGSKYDKAMQLNVKTLDENQFNSLNSSL